MSFNFQPNSEKDSQLLIYNMESISHELSSLLIGGELDGFGAIRTVAATTSCIAGAKNTNGACGVTQLNNNSLYNEMAATASTSSVASSQENKELEMLHLYRQYYHQQQLQYQHLQQRQHQQKVLQQHFNAMPTMFATGHTPNAVAAAHLKSAMPQGLNANMNNNYASVPPLTKPVQYDSQSNVRSVTSGASPKLSSSPKFEFHFLRCQSSNIHPATNTVPLISSAARIESEADNCFGFSRRNNRDGGNCNSGSGQRRFPKQTDFGKEEEIDYDKIVVDLSVLGLSLDNNEPNPVLRLFSLLRKMHYYLNEVLPTNGTTEDSEFLSANLQTNTQTKCSMPCTMNVQYQVRQAARKCTIFLCDMQRILNANKTYSPELYMECEQSLNMMRKLLTQFEAFKRIEMEHKRGQFVTEDAKVQTQNLEKLVVQISDQIRESHIYVHAFNWAVERSKRSMIYNAMKEQQAILSNANEWATNTSQTAAMAMNTTENMVTENKTDVEYSGIAGESLAYDRSYCCNVGAVTVAENESDIDRQSTRYIGYK
ncbi:uncharacterized protein LOC118752490 [Rhagoletis pomonella]|uniref:uncharacterized protein LOC118752490 n=1 Tax=Rhagoletis pomonella TaxID=28610 RepID=UPI00177F3B06|nr:uncharacterized protein LOC118752490 [Rhagoletis pomonella]